MISPLVLHFVWQTLHMFAEGGLERLGVVPGSEYHLQAMQEFLCEAVTQYQLHHANILPLYGIVVDVSGYVKWLVMERGTTSLGRFLKSRGPGGVHLDAVLHMFADVFRGLVFMHSRKPSAIVHCTNRAIVCPLVLTLLPSATLPIVVLLFSHPSCLCVQLT
jgi:serine/threonine protein kinase